MQNAKGVHLHVHSEESQLDGLSLVKELVSKAKSLGFTALGLTDHGVCGAIPDFITECEKQGIKPIPGCESYVTQDRLLMANDYLELRNKLCVRYKIVDAKGKPKLKKLGEFLRVIKKDPSQFDAQANILLTDYLMSGGSNEGSLDLFSQFEVSFDDESDDPLEQFRKDINSYLDKGSFHMVMLAMNKQGLEDLYAINSDAQLNGMYSKPRTDLTFIRENNLGKNIIATSACLGSFFSKLCMAGRIEEAKAHIQEAKNTFHSFYLEKQATSSEDQRKVNAIIDWLAVETNTEKILTTDVHYANKEDYKLHDLLVASSTKECINDPSRKMVYDHEYWMKSDEEMMAQCNDPEAWANTLKIADMVNVTMPKQPTFPEFPIEEGQTHEQVLTDMAWKGLYEIFISDPTLDKDVYSKRLQYELDVINTEGFSEYFLITEDMIRATVEAGHIVGPGRGSGAGSLVCYALKITWLDPIKYNLMFERFLNPERAGYPDLDVDYSNEGALWVQHYLKRKYGKLNVAQIGTKGTFAARKVCKQVGKTLGFDKAQQAEFASLIPDRPGIKLSQAYSEEEAVRIHAERYPEWWEAMTRLEGHLAQVGTHAGGIVISSQPLPKLTPLRLDSDGLETTQFDMGWIEKLLVKFDVLKIDTLDTMKQTLIKTGLWGNMNIYRDIDLNDPNIYEGVFQMLYLSGIFQCESKLFQKIINDMKPTSFEDISVIVALGRPGPLDLIPTYVERKWGREPVRYPFESLKPVLEETYGVWVYQEQVMAASQVLGGLTLGQADMIRKGVAKKKADLMGRWIELMIYGDVEYKRRQEELIAQYPSVEMIPVDEKGLPTIWVDYAEHKENLQGVRWSGIPEVEGALNRGYDLETLLVIQKEWIAFGSYCFNKAHSAAYAMLSCITAWLKRYYPVEFMASLLTSAEGKKDNNKKPSNIAYMKVCEDMGIRVLPPDINLSDTTWTAHTYSEAQVDPDGKMWFGEVRYALSSIAGISWDSVCELTENRPFTSVEDMIQRTNGVKINKTKVVALLKAGAFDSIVNNRNLLLRNYYLDRNEDEHENYPTKTNKSHILEYENEIFGTSISVKSRWSKIEEGATTQVTGVLLSLKSWTAKSSGKTHYKAIVMTAEEEIEVTIWGYLQEQYAEQLVIGNRVTIKGEKSRDNLTAKTVKLNEEAAVPA